jgi:hypothetical protein
MDDRYFITVIREDDSRLHALSRRGPGPDGEPFTGPWRLLTEDEASQLAGAYNADPREGGQAEVIEVFRFSNDPDWPGNEI